MMNNENQKHEPAWYKNAVLYELYIRAFADGNGDGHGDFWGLIEKLDYLKELGISCIWLLPMYPSPLKDGGYDISDYCDIHPDFGNLEIFEKFLNEAHARDMRVIADLVLNHTSDQHPWFQAARSDPNSPYREYYVWSDSDQKYKDARIIFVDTETSNWEWDQAAGQYYWHRFYACQPDLNFDSPKVQQEMLDVIKFWLDLGLDGFRVDAVPYLYEREGTSCENLPESHAYLRKIRKFVDENYPGRILLAEANQWPQDLLPYFGDGDEFHMAFHFPLMPRIYMALKKGDRQDVVDILSQTPTIPRDCEWCIFLRNHDELTLEMVTEEERQWMWQEYATQPRMRLNLGIRRRLAPLLDNNQQKMLLANSLLFTLLGVPIIYYGDEIGMGDSIWLNDRDGVRAPMQWNNRFNAGFSHATSDRMYSPVISDPVYGFQKLNVENAMADQDSLWQHIRRMIHLHKEYLLFANHHYNFLDCANKAVLPVLRQDDDEHILAVHNLSDRSQRARINLGDWAGSKMTDLISQNRYSISENGDFEVELTPYQYLWLHF
jgi:maltose alpha-D-glucosyltransferase/alpha-amylase